MRLKSGLVMRDAFPPADFIETRPFETPIAYRIPNFNVRVYGPAPMAGGTVNALLSLNRSVPRDVYDLHELIRKKADPAPLGSAESHANFWNGNAQR